MQLTHVLLNAHAEYKNEGESVNEELKILYLFLSQTKRQHLDFICQCECLPSPVCRGVKMC